MTDELQQDLDQNVPEDDFTEGKIDESSEDLDTGSESAPDTTGEAPAVKFTPEQQAVLDREIGKKVAKAREAERELERVRAELTEIKSKSTQETRPTIPPLPDPLNFTHDEWKQKMAEREAIVNKAARYDERLAVRQADEQRLVQQKAQAESEELNQQIQSYAQRATALGMTTAELQQAGNEVGRFGIHDSVAQTILRDDHGPLITKYLAANPVLLDEISRLDPVTAGIRIAVEVKPRALALKPKVNSAPAPLDTPANSGKTPSEGGPKGVKYDWGS